MRLQTLRRRILEPIQSLHDWWTKDGSESRSVATQGQESHSERPAPITNSAPVPCRTNKERRRKNPWHQIIRRVPSHFPSKADLRKSVAEVQYKNHITKLRRLRLELMASLGENEELKQWFSTAEATVRTLKLIQQRGHPGGETWDRIDETLLDASSLEDELIKEWGRNCSKYKGKKVFNLVSRKTNVKSCSNKLYKTTKALKSIQRRTSRLRLEEKSIIAMIEKDEQIVKEEGGKLEKWRQPTGLERWGDGR